MTNPTSNFNWQMPTPTDLVTDLPADFEVFGQAVDTSMADLLGGTTGQILAKATNADMDFAWITNDVGDITAVNVTSPITGGGSSGAVTIGVSAASTAAAGVVQLSDSTSTTSSVLASTPTATKSAYDLADAAIAKSVVTTAGDIIYRNATVPARLGIGTAGQVLAVNSGATAPEWIAAPAGRIKQIVVSTYTTTETNNTSTFVDSGLTATITPTSASSTILVMASINGVFHDIGSTTVDLQLLRTATVIGSTSAVGYSAANGIVDSVQITKMDSPATTSATTYKIQFRSAAGVSRTQLQRSNDTSTLVLMEYL
jgi:hypothetical protein